MPKRSPSEEKLRISEIKFGDISAINAKLDELEREKLFSGNRR